MYSRILIPVDGSDEARNAARHGFALAQLFDASVSVLHVVEQKKLRLARGNDEETELRKRGETILKEIAELGSEYDRHVSTKLVEGKPAPRITKYADEQDADLIVIGRQGMTGLGKRLLGGVTEQVLHRSDIPVFVVSGADHVSEKDIGYSQILFTTDGSENAEAAIPHGVAIAQNFDSTIHVLNVVDLQAAGGVFDAGGLEKEFIERLEAKGQEIVERSENEIRGIDPDIDIRTVVKRTASLEGVPAGIREYLGSTDVDLVVMSSHGRSNLKRQLLGSVASTVLRTVDVPVLIVKRTS